MTTELHPTEQENKETEVNYRGGSSEAVYVIS